MGRRIKQVCSLDCDHCEHDDCIADPRVCEILISREGGWDIANGNTATKSKKEVKDCGAIKQVSYKREKPED